MNDLKIQMDRQNDKVRQFGLLRNEGHSIKPKHISSVFSKMYKNLEEMVVVLYS